MNSQSPTENHVKAALSQSLVPSTMFTRPAVVLWHHTWEAQMLVLSKHFESDQLL